MTISDLRDFKSFSHTHSHIVGCCWRLEATIVVPTTLFESRIFRLHQNFLFPMMECSAGFDEPTELREQEALAGPEKQQSPPPSSCDRPVMKSKNLKYLSIAWSMIVLCSVVGALWFHVGSHDDEVSFALQDRSLLADADHHHAHKPVYEEHHAPLFPLTTRDKVGFLCAVLGLMIAAGGGM